MDQHRQGTRSTKLTETEPDSMATVPQTPNNDKCHHVYMNITEVYGKLYLDQTGRLPVTSNRDNAYVALFFTVDSNYITSYPIKSWHRSELLKAYNKVYSFLCVRGYRPQLHKLDNETSQDVEDFIAEQQTKFQYTPSDMHRTNIAERCIRTWKNHFTSMRAGAPPSFRMDNWCRMIDQCDITLNMMLPCTLNPHLSAFKAMEGMLSFDATPMAQAGTKMLIHLKPVPRHTWDHHTLKEWYIGPSLKHYRIIKGVTELGAMRIFDTFKFKHHALKTPTVTPLDRVIKATRYLATAIQGRGNEPHDKLQAIEHLHALINGNHITTPQQAKDACVTEIPPLNQEPIPEPTPEPVPIAAPVNDCYVFLVFTTTCTPDADNDQRPAFSN